MTMEDFIIYVIGILGFMVTFYLTLGFVFAVFTVMRFLRYMRWDHVEGGTPPRWTRIYIYFAIFIESWVMWLPQMTKEWKEM